MYNDKIENLINFALADGELTEKEKQILFKKAEEEGIDLDEFEMVLNAKLHNKKQSMIEFVAPTTSPKSDKFGDVKKCPSCASLVQSFQIKCSYCGHEYRDIQANSSIQNLFKLLNAAENNRTNSTSSIFEKLQSVFGESDVDKQKKEIISSYPIPTSKEDMIEFLALAIPKSKTVGNWFTKSDVDNKLPNEFANIWKSKCEQIIMKAKFSMKEDKKALEEIMHYARELGVKL
jgi:hypothetical protein